jgi:hypothetical protein
MRIGGNLRVNSGSGSSVYTTSYGSSPILSLDTDSNAYSILRLGTYLATTPHSIELRGSSYGAEIISVTGNNGLRVGFTSSANNPYKMWVNGTTVIGSGGAYQAGFTFCAEGKTKLVHNDRTLIFDSNAAQGPRIQLYSIGTFSTDEAMLDFYPAGSRRGTLSANTSGVYLTDSSLNRKFHVNTTGIGFNGSQPVAKPTITGSRGGNAALASLLTALSDMGLIVDSTSA